MSDKYENEKGVFIDTHTDKNGKAHIDIYSNNPKDDHSSIHINWDSETGKGNIVDNTSGEKETTDINCYLTTACMKHMQQNFDDNCVELKTLRWFRDNFVTEDDINHYYDIAPTIVSRINSISDSNKIYSWIYENVIKACVIAIQQENYEFAYNRYKNSVLVLEEQFAKPQHEKEATKVLKLKTNE